ncbi:MAG: hypothetical protein IKR79_00950 [Bacteroidales bacterium]|nr:hypothetical protein [Bacteroidales bacterium]
MKRIMIMMLMLAMVGVASAQSEVQDTASEPSRFSVQVGLSAGATLYVNANDPSPYYSKYGFQLQIPVLVHYDLTPQWRVSTGLRYDFNWDPLYNGVTELFESEDFESQGLQMNTTPLTGTQHAHIFHVYMGIPLKFTWYPRADDHRLFSLGFDIFAAYAVNQFYSIRYKEITTTSTNASGQPVSYSIGSRAAKGEASLLPWKLELGVTLSTDYIGIIHGVRIFGDLLPRYQDPITGDKFRTMGVTLFL